MPAWLQKFFPSFAKAGPWAVLSAVLLAVVLVRGDGIGAVSIKIDTVLEQQRKHQSQQDTVIELLRLVCAGVAKTDEGRTACNIVGK